MKQPAHEHPLHPLTAHSAVHRDSLSSEPPPAPAAPAPVRPPRPPARGGPGPFGPFTVHSLDQCPSRLQLKHVLPSPGVLFCAGRPRATPSFVHRFAKWPVPPHLKHSARQPTTARIITPSMQLTCNAAIDGLNRTAATTSEPGRIASARARVGPMSRLSALEARLIRPAYSPTAACPWTTRTRAIVCPMTLLAALVTRLPSSPATTSWRSCIALAPAALRATPTSAVRHRIPIRFRRICFVRPFEELAPGPWIVRTSPVCQLHPKSGPSSGTHQKLRPLFGPAFATVAKLASSPQSHRTVPSSSSNWSSESAVRETSSPERRA